MSQTLPSTISVRYCVKCGRTDRFGPLGPKGHYTNGHRCHGEVKVATYRLGRR